MRKYLVRVEAVNFCSFIEDTQDVSTVRGGGLLLLDMAADLAMPCGLTKIYTAASIGLFSVETNDPAGVVAARVRAWIAKSEKLGEKLAEATIAVEVLPSTGDFPLDYKQTLTHVRWDQMRSPTIVYPAETGAAQVCRYDGIRPAGPQKEFQKGATYRPEGEDRVYLSAATKSRRDYGVKAKQRFYSGEAGVDENWEYTNDFDQLTDHPEFGRLHHKLALIYLDGNKFSKIIGGCGNEEALAHWSRVLRANQNSVLRHLLSARDLSAPPPIRYPRTATRWSGKVIDNWGKPLDKRDAWRVETLLWGGDEIIWAVPAWLGWWWLEEFYTNYGRLGEWEIDGKTVGTTDVHDPTGRRLTHGAGVVFCHHDAPLQRLIRLAKELADWPKKTKVDDRHVNSFGYQVLESFDHLGEDSGGVRRDRLPYRLLPANERDPVPFHCLPGDRMREIRLAILNLKRCVPKGGLHALVQTLCRDKDCNSFPEAMRLGTVLTDKATKNHPKAKDWFDAFVETLARDWNYTQEQREAAAWIHLLELWDYVIDPPCRIGEEKASRSAA